VKADKIHASYKDGVLEIEIQKPVTTAPEPTQVAIN
jgi:HSP20 family molecular chaperone IbpA